MPKILVIEDEAPLLEVILTMLRQSGFEAIGASDGATGLHLAHTQQPDLILSDIRMPEMDGHAVLRALRSDPETALLPFIFLTATTEQQDIRLGMKLGADDYLTKPFTNDELLDVIESRLERQAPIRQLQQQLAEVRKAEQLKTDLLRIAAHDLRNPITAIRVALSILKRKRQDNLLKDNQDELDQIAIAIAQMETITSDILSMERIEATVRDDTLQIINLASLVETSFATLRPQAQVQGLTFELNISTPYIPVLADQAQLREATNNLIANAIKYTPEGGEVLIHLDCMGKICRLTVEDTGYGIPESQLDQLFQPFYRVQVPETAMIEGSGLGLHLVKNIIERHQGEVLIQSVYGEGSVFGFFLPIHTETASQYPVLDEPTQTLRQGLVHRLISRITHI